MLETWREIVRWLADRLTVVAAAWLAAGLVFSAFVIWAFTELATWLSRERAAGFDRAVLLWIHTTFPGWLDGPMRIVTALGYYWVVLPLLGVVIALFYREGWRLSAILLLVSTAGSVVLTTVLKSVFQAGASRALRLRLPRLLLFFPERPRHRRRRILRDAHARPGLPAAGNSAMGRGRLGDTRRTPDRLFQTLPRGALPDRRSGRLPRRPPLAGLRRCRVRAVALRSGA